MHVQGPTVGLGSKQLWRLQGEEEPSTWCAGTTGQCVQDMVIQSIVRNPEYGAEARKELAELSENCSIHLHIVDMSKPRDIAKFIKEFKEGNEKLDVLINNAGCMVNKRYMRIKTTSIEQYFTEN